MKKLSMAAAVMMALAMSTACATQPADGGYQSGMVRTEYLVTFRNFEPGEVHGMLSTMEDVFPGSPVMRGYEGGERARVQNYSSLLTTTELERQMRGMLNAMGFSDYETRLTMREGRYLSVEKVIYGRGR